MAQFKTRARAVDMLGRQQIAGIPTAISELFKNAHDAYADHVEVDYYRSDGLFVLRDDGFGMTRRDFQERWLTLGTESKIVSKDGIKEPNKPPGKDPRPTMGEKGIGRLSIASIGPQVLVLTRAIRDRQLHDTVMSFVHWGLFESGGVNIEEIEIPIMDVPGGKLPSVEMVKKVVDRVRRNLYNLESRIEDDRFQKIANDLDTFMVDVQEADSFLPSNESLSLADDGHGTHFFIQPADESLKPEIEGPEDKAKASHLTRMLIGFTNTMTPDHPEPKIKAAFRDHKGPDLINDLIDDQEFFTTEEFRNADHQFRGTFDEYGQFEGTVTIYGEENHHVVPWKGARGKPTKCGPFSIDVAYAQGQAKHSTIPPQQHANLKRKLDRIGGLYIYRDGIRILPYGNHDYDFINIEKRRTKSASYYYFSYRRMLGLVSTDREHNANLVEKAGREGFRQNKAYQQFRSILENFFVQLAADFFRSDAPSDRYSNVRDEMEKSEKLRQRREKKAKVRREEFEKALNDFFDRYERGKPREEASQLIDEMTERLDSALSIKDDQEAAKEVLRVESEAREKMNALQEKYRISKPRIGLTKRLMRDWATYQDEYEHLKKEVFSETFDEIEGMVGVAAADARLTISRQERIRSAVEDVSNEVQKETQDETEETREALENVADGVKELARESVREVRNSIDNVLAELNRKDFSAMDDEEAKETQRSLQRSIEETAENEQILLQRTRTQLNNVRYDRNGASYDDPEEVLAAFEQEVLTLREERDADAELAQLGMAVGIISHEFDSSIQSVRKNLKRLREWANANENLREVYDDIATSFKHLDSYLTLFTPLQRRFYRSRTEIKGSRIKKYLLNIFSQRLERHDVNLVATNAFLRHTIEGFPSTFFPVFVNLVDNAIFWLSDRSEPRRITLDEKGDAFIVVDTGPGIQRRDRASIFEAGFTRKPGGQGMGLKISRDVLKGEGYTLELMEPEPDRGAAFSIRPLDSDSNS